MEDSPAYLAALSQNDTGSFLNTSADAHDQGMHNDQGCDIDEVAAWRPEEATVVATCMQHSRSDQQCKKQLPAVRQHFCAIISTLLAHTGAQQDCCSHASLLSLLVGSSHAFRVLKVVQHHIGCLCGQAVANLQACSIAGLDDGLFCAVP